VDVVAFVDRVEAARSGVGDQGWLVGEVIGDEVGGEADEVPALAVAADLVVARGRADP